ncbi:IS1096 element passenger TnpR family protein [Corynebacterium liangguodongii]|uniref:Plasmid pRiA4b Orf3-like domain-containing protein n=1 Tax=Corynebacterium liangguodongii TaxID=2079535 RepID=A0A2S0WGS3_9CORY|nr:hypothetical protein [Corynebacterium liangguodongii]AWB84926.1 hypothetical protein C3E79_10960 [Corynebacterium liangguodongii]PWB99366.1 hypothetical protein DF219_07315 [Corynebacterium liangguodongii]
MIVSLLMAVEGAEPAISRVVNVDDSMDLGMLAHVIDAAFGFSGGESHVYMAAGEGRSHVIATHPSADEFSEADITVARMEPMTYVYDPSANWNIHVEVLGTSRLDGPTPLLIDAHGPDVVEACNGPALMTKFHTEARRIAAGLDPNMEVAPLLLSFLPVMSPERLLQRLTQADQVTVAERISFVAEDLMIDSAATMEADPLAPEFAADFENFLDSRPDLQDIIAIDPNPEHNPALISAMAAFFEEKLGDLAPQPPLESPADGAPSGSHDPVEETIFAALSLFQEPVKLTASGYLPSRAVKELGAILGIDTTAQRPREASHPQVLATRTLLTHAGLIRVSADHVALTQLGDQAVYGLVPFGNLYEPLHRGLERALGAQEWHTVVRWVARENGMIASGPQRVPDDLDAACALLAALAVLGPFAYTGALRLTTGGFRFIERALELSQQ